MASESRLKLRLLGRLEAASDADAGDRHLGKGKPVALLAYLSCAPGRRASRERLATLLWSDGTSEAARQNLRQTLWYIKRRLGEIVLADDDTIALSAAAASDVDAFVAAAAGERFADAVAAYEGEFAPEFAAPGASAFEEWADLERRRLRATYVSCAEAMSRGLLGSGHAAEAVRVAIKVRELAADDPNSWRLLLECLIAARDTLGIAVAVAQLEGEIEREDVDPDPSIRSLLRTAKKIAGNGGGEPGTAESAESSLVPELIGREAEFRALMDAWEGARRGKGRALLLTGAAGLGKTRLLADFAARVASARGRSLQIRAHPGNRSIPGSMAAQLAESLASLPGAAAISPGSAAVLVALSPLLASAFTGAEPDRATGDDALRRRASALGDLLGVLCESSPIALLVDDAHWADAESMRIVGALRARVDASRALLVVASRIPDDLRLHMGSVEELALQPLDVAGVAEFVGRLASLPTEPWSRGLLPRLHEVTHGIPLLLIETLQRLVESGALVRRDGQWSAVSAESLLSAMPPGSALQARLETLGLSERAALTRLATLGRPVSTDELPADEQVPHWSAVLGELERRSFVTRSEHRISAWHDEVARGVLDLATPEDRLRAHAWVADLLVSRAGSLSDFRLAGLHAMRAADDARMTGAWNAAVRYARAVGDDRRLVAIAHDALPSELSSIQRQRIVQTTPLGQRLNWRAKASIGVTIVAASVLLAVGVAGGGSGDTVGIFMLDTTDSTRALRADLSTRDGWRTGEPIMMRSVSIAKTPHFGLGISGPAEPLPDGSGWISKGVFPDSAGDEMVYVDNARHVTTLSGAPGDDWGGRPSPDGRYVVFSTRRFDRVEHQAELVIIDRQSGLLTRLTRTDEDEVSPLWSPDGTRIAFRREFKTTAELPVVCVMAADGSDEHCDWRGLPSQPLPIDWMDASSLVVQDGATRAVYRLDTQSVSATIIGTAAGALTALQAGQFVYCDCVDESSRRRTLMIAPVANVLALRPVVFDGRTIAGGNSAVSPARDRRPRHLARIAIEATASEVALDGTSAIQVSGFDSSGVTMPVALRQFRSSDDSVLTVAPDGTVQPHRLGRAWVKASAGGWRADSIQLTVVPSSARTVVTERWDAQIEPTWRAFGDPRPELVSTASGRALNPNGDGVYSSGVYLARALAAGRGLGVEFEAQLPVNKFKFQLLGVSFYVDQGGEVLNGWDSTPGRGPVFRSTGCSTSLPSGEGGLGYREFGLSGGSGERVTATNASPREFYSARWHRIRLDYLPDGRCALYVDGLLVLRTENAARVPAMARLVIAGDSKGARMLVRRVEVWEGVRGGR